MTLREIRERDATWKDRRDYQQCSDDRRWLLAKLDEAARLLERWDKWQLKDPPMDGARIRKATTSFLASLEAQ